MTTAPPLDIVRDGLDALRAYVVPPSAPPVKLDANESPWPLPPDSRARIAEAIAAIPFHRYPDPRATALREALATRTGGRPDDLLIGCGSDEVISLLLTALARPRSGRPRASVVYPDPSFVMYRITAIAHGFDPVPVPLDAKFQLDTTAMLEAIRVHRPNVVFLASPNNPTGNAFDDAAIEAIVRGAPDALVVVDEAYAPFHGRSLTSLCDRYANAGVMSTLSKIGVAAARVGWVRLHPDLAREVDKARQPFNLSTLAQEVARLALTELAPIFDAHVASIVRERERLAVALRAVPGLEVLPTDANFVLVRLPGGHDAEAVARALEHHGVAVRAFGAHLPRLAGHVRITVGTPEENDALLARLPGVLA